MKRTNDVFVSVNPNSPRKRRRKRLISPGKVINFGNAGMASDSPRRSHTLDENQPKPTLDSPWTPLPTFRTWDPGAPQNKLAQMFRLRLSSLLICQIFFHWMLTMILSRATLLKTVKYQMNFLLRHQKAPLLYLNSAIRQRI